MSKTFWSNTMNWINSLFRKPSAAELAQRELEECERSILEHERARDYHEMMVVFNRKRISSLTTTLLLKR